MEGGRKAGGCEIGRREGREGEGEGRMEGGEGGRKGERAGGRECASKNELMSEMGVRACVCARVCVCVRAHVFYKQALLLHVVIHKKQMM